MDAHEPRHRWLVAVLLIFFAVIHYVDRSLLPPILPTIMNEFSLNSEQVGLISTTTLVVTTACFILWGYLYDKYSRTLLTTIAGIVWALSTWWTALSRQLGDFFAARTSSGIDDAATPGMNALLSDYFPPKRRSTILGLMNTAPYAGFLIGGLVGTIYASIYGWRILFFATGFLGIIAAILVFLFVKDVPRGKSEPELVNIETTTTYTINRKTAVRLIRRPSMLLLCLQGFFGMFPWNILTFWIFTYLDKERMFGPELIAIWLVMALGTMIIGTVVAGVVGDFLFRRNRRGRMLLSATAVFLSAVMIYLLFARPTEDIVGFFLLSAITAFVTPMASPNITATVFDITEPEARSTGLSILRWFENAGSAFAPLFVGVLWSRFFGTLGTASWVVCVFAWTMCGTIFAVLTLRISDDIERIRILLVQRAQQKNETRSR